MLDGFWTERVLGARAPPRGFSVFFGAVCGMLTFACEQLAMLARYDAMLDASSVETGIGNLQVDNQDGRFMLICRFNLSEPSTKYAQNKCYNELCVFDDSHVLPLWLVKLQ